MSHTILVMAISCKGQLTSQPYVGNPRSEEKNSESRFLLAHVLNPCTWIQRNPRGVPVALAEWIPDSLNPGGGNEYRIRDCLRRLSTPPPRAQQTAATRPASPTQSSGLVSTGPRRTATEERGTPWAVYIVIRPNRYLPRRTRRSVICIYIYMLHIGMYGYISISISIYLFI